MVEPLTDRIPDCIQICMQGTGEGSSEVDLIFFNGTVMRGQPDHANLQGARFVREARTAPRYRLYSIDDRYPAMMGADDGLGVSVTGEIYEVPRAVWPDIDRTEPPGLYRGDVELDDGVIVLGMLGDPDLIAEQGCDISTWGDWREYRASRPSGEREVPDSG